MTGPRGHSGITLAIACAAWLLVWLSAAGAVSGLERIHQRVAALALGPVPPLHALRRRCGEDVLCAGRELAEALGPRSFVRRGRHPDTDAIRLVRVLPSITARQRLRDGRCMLRLRRFGMKAVAEVRHALQVLRPCATLLLDLRGNGGGDFGRMLRVAGMLIGEKRRAVRLRHARGDAWRDVPRPAHRPRVGRIVVLVDGATASSAEILAALLRRHAGARLLGHRTRGKNWLLGLVPLNHDWQLMVPSAIASLPGMSLAHGLAPDGPLPPYLPAY